MPNVKLEGFLFDYFNEELNKTQRRNDYIYELLENYDTPANMCKLNKIPVSVTFSNEQLILFNEKQQELGYDDNFSKFVRCVLFDDFSKHYVAPPIQETVYDELPEPIDLTKFDYYIDKCRHDLIHGDYTSYDLNLLRDNDEYKNDISVYCLEHRIKKQGFNADFLEFEMINCLINTFDTNPDDLEMCSSYLEAVGESTTQYASKCFRKMNNGEILEPFTDYDNIVPDTNSYYYLYIYHVFLNKFNEEKMLKVFNEKKEHIDFLINRYTFDKVILRYKKKYNVTNHKKIFDEECLKRFKAKKIIG